MATIIPTLGSVKSRMTNGEKRFAERLEDKLEDDYLCWYDVAIGGKSSHPDFVIFHPSRGLLVLEVKDWKLTTIQSIDKQAAVIFTDHGIKNVLNPIEQARQYMFVVTNKLERDPQLTWPSGSLKGKPAFPYGHGVVLTNIDRAQFDKHEMGHAIPSHLVICKDEMFESADVETFQKRLWDMFPYQFNRQLSLPQIDRIRWHMFPEIRIQAQPDMFDDSKDMDIPDMLRVMDIQQEQLARSLGEGHRVIHGVAGSGKTLILGYRAEHLAMVCKRPILILCYNTILAAKLASVMAAKGLANKVNVVSFHAWCTRQLDAYHITKPRNDAGLLNFEACVEKVIRSVDQKLIPSGQYDAVLIDEGHDFKAEWLKLVVQMINPESDSLLVLYDDAQSIYGGAKKKRFTFASVGVKAQGRTTILKLNYRNTAEILSVARAFAEDLLLQDDGLEDGAPTVHPMSAGRHGPKPTLIKLPKLADEAEYFVNRLMDAQRTGMPWSDMAIIYRYKAIGLAMTEALKRKSIPYEWQADKKLSFESGKDGVKVVTMHSSKGLEFPMVCIPAVGLPNKYDSEPSEEARLLYVAMTRATQELLMSHSTDSLISEKIKAATALELH